MANIEKEQLEKNRREIEKKFDCNPLWLDTSELDADNAKVAGVKYDNAKPQYSLVPADALHEIVKVLTFGAQKYSPDNWKRVPDLQRRYFDALQRHLYAFNKEQAIDPESGYHHLAHAGCCLMFMLQDHLDGDK